MSSRCHDGDADSHGLSPRLTNGRPLVTFNHSGQIPEASRNVTAWNTGQQRLQVKVYAAGIH